MTTFEWKLYHFEQNKLSFDDFLMTGNALELEIVMNELQKLKMSADFFANTSHDICRCPGVQKVLLYIGGM